MNKQKFDVVKLKKTSYLLIMNKNQLKNQITKNDIFIYDNLTSLRKNYFRSCYDNHARYYFKNILIEII